MSPTIFVIISCLLAFVHCNECNVTASYCTWYGSNACCDSETEARIKNLTEYTDALCATANRDYCNRNCLDYHKMYHCKACSPQKDLPLCREFCEQAKKRCGTGAGMPGGVFFADCSKLESVESGNCWNSASMTKASIVGAFAILLFVLLV